MVAARRLIFGLADIRYEFGSRHWGLLYEAPKDIVIYALAVALTHGVYFYLQYRQRELLASQLEASLANARLETLKQQIQPHFLFNTLNMISSTMHEDVERADHMIATLSDLLRMTVLHHASQEVPISVELAILGAYREIMEARFEERLSVTVDVSPDCGAILVPPLLIQPLVENAIKHGIATREIGGSIQVSVTRVDNRVRIVVVDDGPGTTQPLEELLTRGVGLSSTVERLNKLYDSAYSFDIRNRSQGGLEILLTLPYKLADNLDEIGE
jgi:sensor histidine kinase YesM